MDGRCGGLDRVILVVGMGVLERGQAPYHKPNRGMTGEGRRHSAKDPGRPALAARIAIPALGNGPHINQFKGCMINIGSRLCLLVAGVTIVAGSVFAQVPGKPEPTPAAPLNSAPGENLSEKLNRSNGVIHPKEVDPTIEKPRPRREIRTWCRRQGLQAALPRHRQNEGCLTTSGPGRPQAGHSGALAAFCLSPAIALGDRFHEFDPPCALIGLISDP